MRVVVIGAGMAGLTAARTLDAGGHQVTVLDEGRRPGGRLATTELGGGARADHGAQFFTVRSRAFADVVADWLADGTLWEWCRGFGADDGHARYAAVGGMAALAAHMAAGLDVRQSGEATALQRDGQGWAVSWRDVAEPGPGRPQPPLPADGVILTAPVPQTSVLLIGHATAPDLRYTPTLTLLASLDRPPAVPAPGGAQLTESPMWSWVADNRAKRVSQQPALTLHTRADIAAARWDEDAPALQADLLAAAAPWLGDAAPVAVAVHRWRYATPVAPYRERYWSSPDGGLVVAGDAFSGPRVEGAFLSGLAAAVALADRERRQGDYA